MGLPHPRKRFPAIHGSHDRGDAARDRSRSSEAGTTARHLRCARSALGWAIAAGARTTSHGSAVLTTTPCYKNANNFVLQTTMTRMVRSFRMQNASDLLFQIDRSALPSHIAIIMDGNG